MIRFVQVFLLFVVCCSLTGVVHAADSALSGNHPLSETQVGELLVAELQCAACHSDVQKQLIFDKRAPDLTEVGSRLSHGYIRRFIKDPSGVHRGTTMPDVLASKPAEEKEEIAEALTHYLIAQSPKTFKTEISRSGSLDKGNELFHTVGCVACHGPRETQTPDAYRDSEFDEEDLVERPTFEPHTKSLDHVASKYSADSLSAFLFQPLKIRPSGRMPDMKLTREEAVSIAQYLVGSEPQSAVHIEPQAALVAKGKEFFSQLNCAACHLPTEAAPPPTLRSLKDADWSRGCLSESNGIHPRYQLSEAKARAIVASFRESKVRESDEAALKKTLTAFNCIACHMRDEYGGVHRDLNSFFQSTEKNLGDDGRMPPPLTGVEAKLQPLALRKVLFDGESVRPYMLTRMPQYGSANVHHVPELLESLKVENSLDEGRLPAEGETQLSRDEQKERRAAARELLGDKGLNCVACHNFNGLPAPVNKGIDLLTMPQRLNREWFHRFLRNPGAFRPRTVMPTAWPNGVAAYQTILDGDTDKQIDAIWDYLSLGTSAPIPPGIQQVSTKLIVEDHTRVYRGRSRVAGFRGVAVGFPEGVNYAFNAETGTLSAIWTGEFVHVNWSGQGAGDFNPASRAITLAQDVSFVQGDDTDAPWPLMPVMTKDAPVNPNPLYPKNLGYRFRGYHLNEKFIPTILYQMGDIHIEDYSVAVIKENARGLKRQLTFDSPRAETVLFRALTGEIERKAEATYQAGKLQMSFEQAGVILRPQTEDEMYSELLLRLAVPQGRSTIELNYVLVNE